MFFPMAEAMNTSRNEEGSVFIEHLLNAGRVQGPTVSGG